MRALAVFLTAVLVGLAIFVALAFLLGALDAKPRKASKRAQAVSGILIGGVGR